MTQKLPPQKSLLMVIFLSLMILTTSNAQTELQLLNQRATNAALSTENYLRNIGNSDNLNILEKGNATYCTPEYSAACGFGDRMINVSLSGESISLDNNSTCSENGYGDYTNGLPRPDMASGGTYTLSVSTDIGFPSQEQVIAWIDYNDDGEFSVDEEIANSGVDGLGSGTRTFDFTTPAGLDLGNYRMRVRMVYGIEPPTFDACSFEIYGEAEDYTITIVQLDDCEGTPTAGTIVEDDFSICAGNEFTLSVSGASAPANGLEFIWQSSPAGEDNWTNLEGPTSNSYTVTVEIVEPTDFRFKVTCTNSDETDISEIVTVNLNPADECYCIPITTAGCFFGDRITNVTLIGLSESLDNNSLCSENGYGDYTNLTPADLAPGETYGLSISTDSSSPNFMQIRAWIDFNEDGQFSNTEEIANSNGGGLGSGTRVFDFAMPSDLDPGNYRMRVRLVYGSGAPTFDACSTEGDGEAEDYTVEAIQLEGCQGTPTAGTINEDDFSICPNSSFSLSISGASEPAIGLERIWQSSTSGEDEWTDIAGATSTSYTFQNGIEETTDFRYKVTCNNSGETAYSNIITISLNPANECYCTPIFTTGCVSGDRITNVSLTGETISLNNTSQCSANGYGDYTNLSSPDLIAGSTYSLSVSTDYGNPTFEEVRAWIDYNKDGQFSSDEEIVNTNGSGLPGGTGAFNFTVPSDLSNDNYRLRVRLGWSPGPPTFDACGSEAYGEAEDYTLSINDTMAVDNQVFGSFNFYPNPTQGQLTLKADKQIESVTVHNLLGQEVINVRPKTLQAHVSMENLPIGVYLMNVRLDEQQKTFKVIKK